MTRAARTGARLRADDRGSVAVLFCFIVLIAGVLVTALVDAGTAIQAANRADTYSAEAARAASIAVGFSTAVVAVLVRTGALKSKKMSASLGTMSPKARVVRGRTRNRTKPCERMTSWVR